MAGAVAPQVVEVLGRPLPHVAVVKPMSSPQRYQEIARLSSRRRPAIGLSWVSAPLRPSTRPARRRGLEARVVAQPGRPRASRSRLIHSFSEVSMVDWSTHGRRRETDGDGGQSEDSRDYGESARAACRGTLHGRGSVPDRSPRHPARVRARPPRARSRRSRSVAGLVRGPRRRRPSRGSSCGSRASPTPCPPGQRAVIVAGRATSLGCQRVSWTRAAPRPARSAGRPRRRAGRR